MCVHVETSTYVTTLLFTPEIMLDFSNFFLKSYKYDIYPLCLIASFTIKQFLNFNSFFASLEKYMWE